MIITSEKLSILKNNGLDFYGSNRPIADDFCFEPPCSVKFTTIEQGCSLGAFSYIVSGFLCGVEIGRYCSFGENVQIGRQNHPMHWLSTSPFLYLNNKDIIDVSCTFNQQIVDKTPVFTEPATQLKTTKICNDVWIGHGAIINTGITIENGAVVAAGSVVTKNVPAFAIVGGNPAKLIRYRFSPNEIVELQASQWWQYSPQQLMNKTISNIDQILHELENMKKNVSPFLSQKITLTELFKKQVL